MTNTDHNLSQMSCFFFLPKPILVVILHKNDIHHMTSTGQKSSQYYAFHLTYTDHNS